MSGKRVCIATLDPEHTGGVRSMATAVYDAAESAGHDPVFLCNSLDREQEVRLTDLFRADLSREPSECFVDGRELVKLPRYLPEFEFLNYTLNGEWWESYIEDCDTFVGVGGSNHCCRPLSRNDKSFSSWTATLYWEDRSARVREQSLVRQAREFVSYPLLVRQERTLYQAAARPCLLSEYTADRVSRRYGIERSELTVIPYPIDVELFSPDGTERDPTGGSPTFLFVGRFNDPRKNTSALLRALDSVRKELPDATVHLIGGSPNKVVQSEIQRLSLEDRITCTNYVPNDELPAYYRGADAFVIPSHQEGLCIAGLEAMACGLPVVSTECGGPEEYVENGENGYLTEPNPESLARAMRWVGEDDAEAARFGKNARDRIEETYAEQAVREQIIETLFN